MSHQTLRAEYVIDRELGYEAVVFGEEGSAESFSVQRALEPDGQDVTQGMDTFCLCLSSGRLSMEESKPGRAHDGEITLRLSEGAASQLGLSDEFTFHMPNGQLKSVLPHLERILV